MRKTFEGLPRTTAYIDDIAQGAKSITEALELLDEAFFHVVLNDLRMNIKKVQFICNEVFFLGYIITHEGWVPYPRRVVDNEKFPLTIDTKRLYSFVQCANHIRRFLENSGNMLPPPKHLAKNNEFFWSEKHQKITNG